VYASAHHRELGKAYAGSLISSPSRNFLGSTFVNVKSLREMKTTRICIRSATVCKSDLAEQRVSAGRRGYPTEESRA
jgi:hypothetical protein